MTVIVQTLGALAEYTPGWWPRMRAGLTLYNDYTADYATMYQTQPGVRTCVDFLARNIAQLGLHLFRRVSETDRVRVREHPLAQLLEQPNPLTTRYRMIEALVGDLAIYFNAYLWKKRRPDGSVGALLRIPCDLVEVNGGIMPTGYLVYLGANRSEVPTADMVHFRGYNPLNGLVGLSPLETLRRVLAEEQAMGEYRAGFWKNAARMNGIIERPAEAPEWSQVARERFKDEFEALYAGEANSGRTAILEEGMTWRQISFSAQESEYLAGRKLSREECARAYHIPLPMVGILDHATYCLPGHVKVFTEEGPRPIRDVRAGDKVWSHDGGGFVLKPVVRSGKSGIDPILRIKTQNRTLEANAKHPVLVRRLVKVKGEADPSAGAKRRAGQSRWRYEARHEFVPAGQIRKGDILVALKGLPEISGSKGWSTGRMEFFGLLIGDGNVYPDRGTVAIARGDGALYMDHYRNVMVSEFESFAGGNGRLREGVPTKPVTLVEGDRQTRFASVLVAEELAEIGFRGTARTKRVPGWVFKASREERLAFLRGYLDADGSVDKRGKISYSSCNPDLIDDIRHLCMSLGIAVNNAYHFTGAGILPNGQPCQADQYAVTLSDVATNREIWSHDPRYQQRLLDGRGWVRKTKRYPFAHGRRSYPPVGCEYSRVVSVEELPAEPVYDLEVADTHNFVAAGVIVHNSNVREQHKQLYQDCLGPWLAMLEQEFELQLLPDFGERDGLYLEFNIAEKLQGSFDEQTQSLQSAVGRPWMTANEARARMNLPSMGGDADALVTPLNVLVGGQASPRDAAPPKTVAGAPKAVAGAPKTVAAKAQAEEDDGAAVLPGGREAAVLAAPGAEAAGPGPTGEPSAKAAAAGAIDPTAIEERRRHAAQWKAQLAKYFRRQGQVMASRVPASGEIPDVEGIWRDSERWDKELARDIYPLNVMTARTWAERVGMALGAEIVAELLYDYLSAVSRTMAAGINMATRTRLAAALTEDDPRAGLKHVFEIAATTRAEEIAITGVTRAANFGSREGAKQGGLRSKTWVVNSGNPRDSHAALDGETVGIDDLFSNGLRYPGDPEGGADDNAGCQCSLAFGR